MDRILEDAQVSERLDAARAVAWVREAVVAASDGRLVAPPRVDAALGGGVLRYTAGELVGTGRQAWTQVWAIASVRELARLLGVGGPDRRTSRSQAT